MDRRSDHIEVIAQGDNDSVLDVQLVAQLQQNGADITKPREILHYLYFPSEDLARNTVEELSKWGHEASEKLSKHPTADAAKPWVVIGRRETVVYEKTIADMRITALKLRTAITAITTDGKQPSHREKCK